jgi:hypothetical protein
MIRPSHYAALLLCFALAGCADQTTFQSYGRAVADGKLPNNLMEAPSVSDGLAINYANSVEVAMRIKFNGNRITRAVSNSAQVTLAALSGVGALLGYSATTVAGMSLASAGIPELQRIFNAKGRAEVYKDGAHMIRRAILEYYAHNPNPSSTEFTRNGLILVQRVSVAINIVDDVLAGQIPSMIDMHDAVEPITPDGTRPSGEVTPDGTRPSGEVPLGDSSSLAALEARIKSAVERNVRQIKTVSPEELQNSLGRQAQIQKEDEDRRSANLPTPGQLAAEVEVIDPKIPPAKKQDIYRSILSDVGVDLQNPPPELKGITIGPTANAVIRVYDQFPAKQKRIHALVEKLKANPTESPLTSP